MNNTNQDTSDSRTPIQSNIKGIARMLDIIFENLNETNSKLNHINE
ncbi:6022_t:CDS:1, partial [Cetraspora pellucida]